jgi:DNA-binding protein HU-beta
MNKSELIDAIAKESKLTKAGSKKALEAIIKSTTKALKKGDKITLVGYGSFSVVKRAARNGRNPQTGKAIKIAAKKVVKFKAGSDLKVAVNNEGKKK